MDGAATSGYSANSLAIAASTTTAGATLLAAANWIAPPQQIVLVSSGNDSGKTIVVSGLAADGYTSLVESVTGANASRTATRNFFSKVISVVPSSTTAGTLSVGVNGSAKFAVPTIISLTSGGNDSAINFTITGTDVNGNTQSEVVAGASIAAAVSKLSYATVTSITSSGATATTLTVGNIVANSYGAWVRLDDWALPQIAIQCIISGTINFTIQSSMDDPNDPTNPVAAVSTTWINSSDSGAVSATGNIQTSYTVIPKYLRVLINSGTGSVTTTITQAGAVPY